MPGNEIGINPAMQSSDYSAMQSGKPYRSYRKTVLAKVYVTMLDPFLGTPLGYLIEGDPKGESAIVDVWNEMQDAYFKRTNKRQFELGHIIPFERPTEVKEEIQKIEQYSDEQLTEIVNSRFYTLQAAVNKANSPAVLVRMIDLAREMGKSEKIIKFLEGRLSEIQMQEFQTEKAE
jgi:hypothetical protein